MVLVVCHPWRWPRDKWLSCPPLEIGQGLEFKVSVATVVDEMVVGSRRGVFINAAVEAGLVASMVSTEERT